MVTVAYNAYCAISMEGDDDTYDGKTAGSRSWEVEATVNSLVGTLFHMIITRMGTDLIFLSRLGSTICFTNFGSHDPIVLYWNRVIRGPYCSSFLSSRVTIPRKSQQIQHSAHWTYSAVRLLWHRWAWLSCTTPTHEACNLGPDSI